MSRLMSECSLQILSLHIQIKAITSREMKFQEQNLLFTLVMPTTSGKLWLSFTPILLFIH